MAIYKYTMTDRKVSHRPKALLLASLTAFRRSGIGCGAGLPGSSGVNPVSASGSDSRGADHRLAAITTPAPITDISSMTLRVSIGLHDFRPLVHVGIGL